MGVRPTIRAFEPGFAVLHQDWRAGQRQAGQAACRDGNTPRGGSTPARRTYERNGFTPLPIVRYFRELRDPPR
ncbi:hypothetical protein [Amycolatopsis magusensis]|uniref:hypothetical protein n=1 Tax=Amycolatopsis magusensis TaxID=882444 RepID=UPI003C2CDB5A